MSQEDYKAAYFRERKARQLAEDLLREKTREVYDNFIHIEEQNEVLQAQKSGLEMLFNTASNAQKALSLKDALKCLTDAVNAFIDSHLVLTMVKNDDIYSELVITNSDNIDSTVEAEPLTAALPQNNLLDLVDKEKFIDSWAANSGVEHDPFHRLLHEQYHIQYSFLLPVLCFDKVIAVIEFCFLQNPELSNTAIRKIHSAALHIGLALEKEKAQKEIISSYAELQVAHKKLKNTKKQLIQSEKMASIGQIAAGVAHEINNPVGFSISNIETLMEYNAILQPLFTDYQSLKQAVVNNNQDNIRQCIKRINQLEESEDPEFILSDIAQALNDSYSGLDRVKNIVKNLKLFARADDEKPQQCNLNTIIEDTIKVLWNELKYGIEIIKDYAELPLCRCNAQQISQVIMNLLVNAKQAIEPTGKITIQTSVIDNSVAITIRDDGCGISEDNLSRIFDPFYTSKPVGVGTGLGLSVSYGIIENHNGKIEVSSKEGSGTCFTVSLPLSATSEECLEQQRQASYPTRS